MGRCVRCCGCECMFDMSPCRFCGYPGKDTRSAERIADDDKFKEEFYRIEDDVDKPPWEE